MDVQRERWRETIQASIKYRKVFMVNAGLIGEEDQVFVLPTFVEAGKHRFVVRSEGKMFVHNFITPVREEDIPIVVKKTKMKVTERVFKKDASVFKDWKEDTPFLLEKCMQHDKQCWKVPRFIKDPSEQDKVWDILVQNFKKLKDLFLTLSCRSIYPCISWMDFSNYCDQCRIPDKNVPLATVDRLFIATNVELEAMDDNPDKALCRFEFLEILVRIANSKYKEPGLAANYSDALQKLLSTNIFPAVQPAPWQEWREQELWTIDVNDLLEANLEGLKKVFSYYFDPRKKYMS
eukprot:CAMPEP_0202967230 /NCGR_PEP_ID=MMETSP1396-20130829/12024_1 /ASSEMBLY_ACC=CAM_ASM_000872 /TAXON_ID= /ORGANISM="Pseudokeronopsis sp., Strain Brazil" /LENGTH=291 /DNA_ID=CAMNT_0049692037 /DNA_START=293 /DNA_END=1165 /DNA_ORIENTATION=+